MNTLFMKKFYYILVSTLLLISCNNKPIDLNVMSFNIRMDTPMDSMNSWQYRKDVAAQIIKDENADIIGTQEVVINQLNDLKSRLSEYNSIGVGREDGKEKGEHCAIFYKKDRFKLIDSGNFWLSQTPLSAGVKGWDAACERVTTWGILEDIESKRQVFVINTHLDHVGKIARQEGVTQLLNWADSLSNGLPIIMTGDFNATPESDVIKHVLDTSNPKALVHTRDIAETKDGLNGTFHDYGKIPLEERNFIDYIFVSPKTKVMHHSVLPEKLNDIFVSDHAVVAAQIQI